MKKLSILLITLSLISPIAYSQNNDLLPELQEFMELKPLDQTRFKGNAYIALMGLTYLKDNWQTAYEETLIHNDPIIQQRVKNGAILTNYSQVPLQLALKIKDEMDSGAEINQLAMYKPAKDTLHLDNLTTEKFLKFQQTPYLNEQFSRAQDYFLCQQYRNTNCINEMQKRKEYIQQVIKDNQVILERFRHIVSSADHYDFIIIDGQTFSGIGLALPTYQPYLNIYQLNLADAVIDFTENNAESGIHKLLLARQWVDLYYTEKSQPTLIDAMIMVNASQFLDQTINALLDSGLLQNYLTDPQLIKTISPYPNTLSQKVFQNTLWDISYDYKSTLYPFITTHNTPTNLNLSKEHDLIITTYLERYVSKYDLPPSLKNLSEILLQEATPNWSEAEELFTLMTLHDDNVNTRITDSIKNISTPQDKANTEKLRQSYNDSEKAVEQWYQNYFKRMNFTEKDAITYLNTKYSSIPFYNDFYRAFQILTQANDNGVLLTDDKISELLSNKVDPKHWEEITDNKKPSWLYIYWARVMEPQNYHQLVYLKYLIFKNKISIDNIPVFLESQKDLAKNIITKEPYSFDVETGILSTPLPIDNRLLPSNVRHAQNNDKTIQNFEVRIK